MPSLLRPWQDLERITQEWRLSIVTPAASLLVATAAELKTHARILFPGEADPFGGAEDTLLEEYIEAAVQEISSPLGWLGRSILSQTLRLTLDLPPPDIVRLPGPPVTSMVSVVYWDTDEVEQTILEADFAANGFYYDISDTGEPALLWNDSWPATQNRPARIKIDYVAGYTDAASVPKRIKTYIMSKAAESYRDREASNLGVSAVPLEHMERALNAYRVRM